jgi:hypothetical protein
MDIALAIRPRTQVNVFLSASYNFRGGLRRLLVNLVYNTPILAQLYGSIRVR